MASPTRERELTTVFVEWTEMCLALNLLPFPCLIPADLTTLSTLAFLVLASLLLALVPATLRPHAKVGVGHGGRRSLLTVGSLDEPRLAEEAWAVGCAYQRLAPLPWARLR